VSKESDERDADIAARACEPRQNLDIRKTETALLVMMLSAEQCAIVLWGSELEHAPDDEDDARAELQRAMNEAAAEINRRIPIPEGP
jgi:hypothetical protein